MHLVDGMRLNNAFFRNAPNQYLGLVDAYMTDKMEIVRGSAPSLYGADAMGGVVQVLSTEPDFSGSDWQGEGRIYGSFNSVDSSFVARAEAATGRDGSALSGGLTYQDHSDRKVGGGGKVNPAHTRSGPPTSNGGRRWAQARKSCCPPSTWNNPPPPC